MSGELREVQGLLARIEISEWKAIDRGALKGVFSITVPSGMILHECTLFEKEDGKRWVAGPQKQYRVGDITKYTPLIAFIDRATRDRFNETVLNALDEHLRSGR